MITTLENVKLYHSIEDNLKDNLINFLIPQVEEYIEEYRGLSFKKVVDPVTGEYILVNGSPIKSYPKGSELVAIQIVGAFIKDPNISMKQSESLGDYSISFIEFMKYAKDYLKGIRKYAKVM